MAEHDRLTKVTPETQAQLNQHIVQFVGEAGVKFIWRQPKIESLKGKEILLAKFGIYWRPLETSAEALEAVEQKAPGVLAMAIPDPNYELYENGLDYEYGGEELARAFLEECQLYKTERDQLAAHQRIDSAVLREYL